MIHSESPEQKPVLSTTSRMLVNIESDGVPDRANYTVYNNPLKGS